MKKKPSTVGLSAHGAFDRNESGKAWTFWARSAPSIRVIVNDIRWFNAREKAAILLQAAPQDITDR